MQCVGTLSWSGIRLASPARTSRRTLEAPEIGGQSGAQWPGTASHTQGSKVKTTAARQASVEVNPLEIDWSQVVRRCMDGDSGAWAELVRTHHRRVYGLCYRFTGNPADAEDLTQDVFLKVYSNLASFDTGRG